MSGEGSLYVEGCPYVPKFQFKQAGGLICSNCLTEMGQFPCGLISSCYDLVKQLDSYSLTIDSTGNTAHPPRPTLFELISKKRLVRTEFCYLSNANCGTKSLLFSVKK